MEKTGRLLGIWKPKLVKPRSKTKPCRRAIAGRITFLRSSHGNSPLLRQNRGRTDFRQLPSWPSSPGLLCFWGGSVFPSALAHLSELVCRNVLELSTPYDLHHLCCSWWQVTFSDIGWQQTGKCQTMSPVRTSFHCDTCRSPLVCSQAFRAS